MSLAPTNITHTLWVFDLAGPDEQFKVRSQIMFNLNNLFMANCTDGTVTTARAVWVNRNATITPGDFDSVVFLELLQVPLLPHRRVLSQIVGGSIATLPPNGLGITQLGLPTVDLAEVFWDRCINSDEVASSIFHESAHLKSGQVNSMHNFHTPGMGGSGVRVLRDNGSKFKYPSYDDLLFYTAAIKRRINLRDRVPIRFLAIWDG